MNTGKKLFFPLWITLRMHIFMFKNKKKCDQASTAIPVVGGEAEQPR